MNKKLLLVAVLLVIGTVGLSGCGKTPTTPPAGNNTAIGPTADAAKWELLAKTLTAKGAKMYGAYWCSHCKEQEAMFGESFKFVTYVESADAKDPYKQTPAAIQAGITGYPTWIFADGSRVERVMTFDELSKKVGLTP